MPTTEVEPACGFQRFQLSDVLLRNLDHAGYDEPRPIQLETIPQALEGRDILGLAQTGTGKTAAFTLPILENLLERRGSGAPRVLVVAPTRELAVQIDGEFRKLARNTRIRSVVIHGGVSERPQIKALQRRPDVIVACPGRLLDLVRRREVRLDRIETLVLDEADHMFDMGFLPDLRRIIAELPRERQNLLFAATMPREIRQLAERILRKPFVAELAHSRPARTIEHQLYPVAETRKLALLEHLVSREEFVSAIVFTRTKYRARRLAQRLERAGHRTVALQGNMSQGQRDRAMSGFRSGHFDILVATDIAARGIDVEQVSHVVNFDVPNTPDAYTHRIGRTGRSERSGRAFTFVTEEDRAIVQAIERKIGARIETGTVEGFDLASLPAREPERRRSGNGTRRKPTQGRRSRTQRPRSSKPGTQRARSSKPGAQSSRSGSERARSRKPGAQRTPSGGSRGGRGPRRRRRRSSD